MGRGLWDVSSLRFRLRMVGWGSVAAVGFRFRGVACSHALQAFARSLLEELQVLVSNTQKTKAWQDREARNIPALR